MSWPTPAEINEAVQNPQLSFHDPELSAGAAELDPQGIPLARSGSNADVYCFTCGAEKVAVKCFTRPIAHLEHRYRAIHAALSSLRLPFTVDCGYQAKGIWLRDEWYPLVRMRWVDGIRLNEFARAVVGRKEMLDTLIRILSRMGDWLEVNRLGHCDLQHGNILLIPSHGGRKLALRLVDYDGMWVPALDRDPPAEFGHPDYQHPARASSGYYGPAADRFSLLAIATGLRAVMAHGDGVWMRYDNTVNILFTQKDYQNPHRSPLFAELGRSPDDLVRRLCGALGEACTGPLDRVPPLSEVLTGTPVSAAGEDVPMAEPVDVLPLPDGVAPPPPYEVVPPPAPGPTAADFDFAPGAGPGRSGPEGAPAPARPVREPPPARVQWLWVAGPAGALVLGLVALWATGVFRGTPPPDDTARDQGNSGSSKTEPGARPPAEGKTRKKPETVQEKGQKAVDAFHRNPRRFLAGTTWEFYRNTKGKRQRLGQLTLAEDGRILGSTHPNETTWKVDGDRMLFLNRDAQTTTTYERVLLEGNRLVLFGVFGKGVNHELIRDVE